MSDDARIGNQRSWLLPAMALLVACTQSAQPTAAGGFKVVSPAAMRSGEAPMDPALQRLVDVAVDDLARRLSIGRAEVAVIEARQVVWPDRSLGCPRPGMNYPQVQQDGLLIRLRALGREFSYHSGGARQPFLCENAA